MDEPKFTLAEHLDEFRLRLIYCLIAFGLCSSLAWQLVPTMIGLIAEPAGKLVFIHPAEAFFSYFKIALWGGFFFSLPVIIYNVWKFIESALLPAEKKQTLLFAVFSFILFVLGGSFGFFLAIPLAVKFLVGFGSGWVEPMLSIGEYISFICSLLLAFGLAFELPLAILFLAKLKIVDRDKLKAYRRHAIVAIFIAAAILTPTPDIFTQCLLAGPLIILYELGVFLARYM